MRRTCGDQNCETRQECRPAEPRRAYSRTVSCRSLGIQAALELEMPRLFQLWAGLEFYWAWSLSAPDYVLKRRADMLLGSRTPRLGVECRTRAPEKPSICRRCSVCVDRDQW